MANIAVFCGAREGVDTHYIQQAEELGGIIAKWWHTLVYGGGIYGVMGWVYRWTTENGGKTISIIPHFLTDKERSGVLTSSWGELILVDTMDERKKILFERSESVIMLPGGIGTLDEFMEACILVQLGRQQHTLGILNTGGFYDPLIEFLSDLVAKGFMSPDDFARIQISQDPARLLSLMSL